jgi:hypothetical protein
MRGLDPRIHADVPQSRLTGKSCNFNRTMDCRVKPGNDALRGALSS